MIREFYYHGSRIPDPNLSPSMDQARDVLVPMDPQIATVSVTGPEVDATGKRYTFARAIGSKG
jgi:PRTRC genetic system protein C